MPKHMPMPLIDKKKAADLRRQVRAFYRRRKRALPFRETRDPYAITVSEIMLQQTQVERVVPKYLAWLRLFPDWEALARADNRTVFAAWSGLGYNRRALYLRDMARAVVDRYDGRLPADPAELRKLPGIGPYTAHAIVAFAFGKRVAAVDTNVRRVIIHLLDLPPDTPLKQIEDIAAELLPRTNVREWHYALMDYARLGMDSKAHRRIKPLSRQSRFEGSLRQIRGEIIRQLTDRASIRIADIARTMQRSEADVRRAADSLARENVVVVTSKTIRLL